MLLHGALGKQMKQHTQEEHDAAYNAVLERGTSSQEVPIGARVKFKDDMFIGTMGTYYGEYEGKEYIVQACDSDDLSRGHVYLVELDGAPGCHGCCVHVSDLDVLSDPA